MLGNRVSFFSLVIFLFVFVVFFFLFVFFSFKRNFKGFSGKVEKEKIEDNQNTKRITQIHAANILIDRQIAVLHKPLSLLLRADTRRKQCEKDVTASGKIVTLSESLLLTTDAFTELTTE